MATIATCRQTGAQGVAGRPGAARAGILRAQARPWRSRPAGQLRHQRSSRLAVPRHVHRSAHPRDHAGDLRLPPQPGDRRPAVHGQGHPRAVWAGAAHRARSARGQWRETSSSATTASRRRRSSRAPSSFTIADARNTSLTASSSRHRTIRRGRRLQVQPAQRRSGGHGRDRMDPGPRQRAAARAATRR